MISRWRRNVSPSLNRAAVIPYEPPNCNLISVTSARAASIFYRPLLLRLRSSTQISKERRWFEARNVQHLASASILCSVYISNSSPSLYHFVEDWVLICALNTPSRVSRILTTLRSCGTPSADTSPDPVTFDQKKGFLRDRLLQSSTSYTASSGSGSGGLSASRGNWFPARLGGTASAVSSGMGLSIR